jgi:hypothetical protein
MIVCECWKGKGPAGAATPRDLAHSQPLAEVDIVGTTSIRKLRPKVPPEKRLAHLEQRYRRELMDAEERCELWERIIRLRCKLGF